MHPQTESQDRAMASLAAATGFAVGIVVGRRTSTGDPATAQPPSENSPRIPPTADEFDKRWTYLAHGMMDTRTLLQRQGAALATALTAIVVGLGYAHFHDFLPLPKKQAWPIGSAIVVLLLVLVSAVGYLGSLFFSAQRRIMITPATPTTSSPIDARWPASLGQRAQGRFQPFEIELIKTAYEPYVLTYVGPGTAQSDRYDLRRVQAGADNMRGQGAGDAADRLEDVVRLAVLDAAAGVLEYRSVRAHERLATRISYFAAAGAILALFLLADYVETQRPASRQNQAEAALKQQQADLAQANATLRKTNVETAEANADRLQTEAQTSTTRLANARACAQLEEKHIAVPSNAGC